MLSFIGRLFGNTPPANLTPSQSLDRLRVCLNFWLALAVIIAILLVFMFVKVSLTDQTAASVVIAGLGLIGTVIGSVVGHTQGAAGKEQEADRADARIKAVQLQADAHIQTLQQQVTEAQGRAQAANDTLKQYLKPPNP